MARNLSDPGPFRIRVYDKAFAFMFPLGGVDISVTPRHQLVGTATLSLPLLHPRTAAMFTPGTRVTIDYLIGDDRTDDASWLRLMSGPIWTRGTSEDDVPTAAKKAVFVVEDDVRILNQILGWAVPGSAIGSQSANAYDARTGDAESVIKGYVTANATRLSLPVTAATNAHRGATVKGLMRFDKLGGDDALPAFLRSGSGLGITVTQVGSGLVLDVYEPTDRTATVLTEASGGIRSWQLTTSGPTATRAVVAAQGEGTARVFSVVTTSASLATETEWGTKAEVFVDARDTSDSTTLTQRGQQALIDGQPTAGFSLTLAETNAVKFGKTMFVGDLIAFQPLPQDPSLVLTDVLTEVTLTQSAQNGFTVTPRVGNADNDQPSRLIARAINRALTGVNKLRSGL